MKLKDELNIALRFLLFFAFGYVVLIFVVGFIVSFLAHASM